MIYLVALLVGLAVALVVTAVGRMVPARPRAVARQLVELERLRRGEEVHRRRERSDRSRQLRGLLELVGERVGPDMRRGGQLRQFLIHAGYQDPAAPVVYWGSRVVLLVVLGPALASVVTAAGGDASAALIAGAWGAAFGWVAPAVYVGRRVRARQEEIRVALPDALDLMVVCVEAGLALNQALVRVAEEIRQMSRVTSEEFALVNLEIRAGIARDEALRNLGERTGVADVQSLVGMLVQTDRFGTSIAQALRVHSDSLRIRRRQRAEEAAAKTTIKLVFPLALCIFPALFVVILGPAMVSIYRTLLGLR